MGDLSFLGYDVVEEGGDGLLSLCGNSILGNKSWQHVSSIY